MLCLLLFSVCQRERASEREKCLICVGASSKLTMVHGGPAGIRCRHIGGEIKNDAT